MPDPVENVESEEVETEEKETHEGFIDLESHQKDVNVQHKKFRDQERGRVAAEERAATAERKFQELQSRNNAVVIPPIPDKYSDNFDAEMRSRDRAIEAKTAQDAELKQAQDQRLKDNEASVATQNQAITDKVAGFDSNMVALGLNPVETKADADAVISFGVSNNFQDILLEDPDGPLLVKYLAANPIEVEKMNGMSTLGLVNHINSDVRAKASLLRPQTSNAPNPPIVLDGGGAPTTAEAWEKGAKYE